MNKTSPAAFIFTDYKIKTFEFKIPEKESIKLAVAFKPSGIFKTSTGTFCLTLDVKIVDDKKKDNTFVKVLVTGDFKFSNVKTLKEVPDYFWANSIAIIFPYIRSFISTLTLQANWEPFILPILNLINLRDDLKENTVEKK